MTLHDLPKLNAVLNATCAGFLILGFGFIRRGRVPEHRRCMWAAFITSCVFMLSYLTYHAQAGSKTFAGEGWIRSAYLAILVSHAVLAAAIVPMAILTLRRAVRQDFDRHRRIARWTLPIWLYVSVTGVVVYWLLYQAFPAN